MGTSAANLICKPCNDSARPCSLAAGCSVRDWLHLAVERSSKKTTRSDEYVEKLVWLPMLVSAWSSGGIFALQNSERMGGFSGDHGYEVEENA